MSGVDKTFLPVRTRTLEGNDIASLEGVMASHDQPSDHARLFATYMALGTVDVLVAETRDKRVVGYLIYAEHKNGAHRAYELLDMAVAPDCKRQGVGSQLIDHVVRRANRSRTGTQEWKMWAAVKEDDFSVLEFLRACGMRANVKASRELAVPGNYFLERRELTLEDKAREAIAKLGRLTEGAWELVVRKDDGSFSPLPPNKRIGSKGDAIIRTVEPLKFPNHASDLLVRMGLHARVLPVDSGSEAAQIAIPLSDVPVVRKLTIQDGRLADDFAPASQVDEALMSPTTHTERMQNRRDYQERKR